MVFRAFRKNETNSLALGPHAYCAMPLNYPLKMRLNSQRNSDSKGSAACRATLFQMLGVVKMTNVATVLKTEVRRIARKEVRTETSALRKAVAGYRAEVATLKRRAAELEKQLKRLPREAANSSTVTTPDLTAANGRYSAKSLASQRRRLGLSANELGQLIGVSAQSIYNWEEAKARPYPKFLPAIFALKTLGRKAAVAHLDSLAANVERKAA